MTGSKLSAKLFAIIILLGILGSLAIQGAEHMEIEDIEDVDWSNVGEIMNLDDAFFVNSLTARPDLLVNPTVMDALNIKIIAGRTDLINGNPVIMQAWGGDKGIAITPTAQIETYDGTIIKTRGLRATTFNPNDVQGASVLADGSLQLPNQYTVSGIIEKEESGLAIMGELKDRAGNRLVNEKSHVTLETDGVRTIIRSYGETKVYTKDGDFRTISGERSEYQLRFNEKNELVITTLALTTEDLKNPVKIISPKPENNFVLLSGEATIQSVNKVLFEGIQIGATITPALFEIYGPAGEEQASTFTVTKPTLLCFDECNNGLREIQPTDYTTSSIEVLRPITYSGEPYERNILKITARENNQLDVHLTNPDQNSIFLDAPGENRITLTQEGKVLQGTEVKPYFSMITATDSNYTFRGKADTELSGSKILILGKDAAFDEQNALVVGKILTFQPGIVGGIGFIEPEDGFDLLEYHLGMPLPVAQKIVGEIIDLELEDIRNGPVMRILKEVTEKWEREREVQRMMDELTEEGRHVEVQEIKVQEIKADFLKNLERVDSGRTALDITSQFDDIPYGLLESEDYRELAQAFANRLENLEVGDFEGLSTLEFFQIKSRLKMEKVERDGPSNFQEAYYLAEVKENMVVTEGDSDLLLASPQQILEDESLFSRFCSYANMGSKLRENPHSWYAKEITDRCWALMK